VWALRMQLSLQATLLTNEIDSKWELGLIWMEPTGLDRGHVTLTTP
jgi:hypothetical protein